MDIIVKSDNEPPLTSLIESSQNLRAIKGGSRMMAGHSVGSSKSNGTVSQSVQGTVRILRSSREEKWRKNLEAAHSIWPWIAEHAGFSLTRLEVVCDGQTPYERLKGYSAKVQGMMFAEGTLWKRKRPGGPHGQLTCKWEDGVNLSVKATTGESIVGNRGGVWLTRTVRKKDARERTMGSKQSG